MYNDTLTEIEKQRRKDYERRKQQEREKAYNEATKSASFSIFNSTIAAITAIIAIAACLYFLWGESKFLFTVVVIMLVLSYIFRKVSKYYFIKGNRKKFEFYNKLAGIMGVSSTLVELADYNRGKTRGAFSKAENVEDSTLSVVRMVRETITTGGVYIDPKYDSYRKRCIDLGRYIYLSGDQSRAYKVLAEVRNYENEQKNIPKDCLTCVNTFYMLVEDILSEDYNPNEMEVVYAAIGALHYFVYPLSNLPDSLPVVGYTDNMYMPLCVTAGFLEELNAYKDWKIQKTKEREVVRTENGLLEEVRVKGTQLYVNTPQLQELLNTVSDSIAHKKYSSMSDDVQLNVIRIYNLIKDSLVGEYKPIDTSALPYCIGALAYLINHDDVIKDSTPITGLIDDEVVIKAACNKCKSELQRYVKWSVSKTITNKMDPLIDYLDTVIGDDVTERSKEIERLADMCNNKELTSLTDRARSVIVALY